MKKRRIIYCLLALIFLGSFFLLRILNNKNGVVGHEDEIQDVIENNVEEKLENKIDELPVVDSNGKPMEISSGTVADIPESASVSATDLNNNGDSGNHGTNQNSDEQQDDIEAENEDISNSNELPMIEYHS